MFKKKHAPEEAPSEQPMSQDAATENAATEAANADASVSTETAGEDTEAPERTPEELEQIHTQNALTRAMDQALTDLRQRSYEGKLTKPARWKKMAFAPEGMDASEFEEQLLDLIEDGPHAEDKPVFGRVEVPKPLDVQLEGKEVSEDDPLPKLDVSDIAIIYGKKGTYLYSVALMSHSFAHALFLTTENDDIATFVDVVRNESRIYPRPVSEVCFINPPYLWSRDKTTEVFKRTEGSASFKDIHVVHTTQNEAFYYSDLYLSEAQAKSLAQWYGVEKGMNP